MNAQSQHRERQQIAALDLGSNSFHLLLAEPLGDNYKIVETLKEKVQLLSGCENGEIQAAAFDRARACIKRFKQRLVPINVDQIFVRGTHALRQATNAAPFIAEVGSLLGSEVVVISGQEEANLVFQAVAHGTSHKDASKLVIDIGGGSTEIATGTGIDVQTSVSLPLGCVSLTDMFVQPQGQAAGFRAAKSAVIAAIHETRDSHPELFSANSQSVVIGTSGTIESVYTVLKSNGWISDAITPDGIRELEAAIVDEQWFVEAGLPGLPPDRVDIFTAGAAIVSACFEALGLSELQYADVSLQHGVLFEALKASQSQWQVNDSIEQLSRSFNVDLAQANRVRRQCVRLYDGTRIWWGDDDECKALLDWAAALHEVGRQVNRRHYHRHGSYIIKNAQIRGLSQTQQTILALLVRGHRRSLPRLAFQAFDPDMVVSLTRLVSLLRIAVIMERSHSDAESPSFDVRCEDQLLKLEFADGWLARHPLSANELAIEVEQMARSELTLEVTDSN